VDSKLPSHTWALVYAIDNWLCAPLEAIAKTANNRDSDYGRLLKYRSSKGEEKLWAMPMELLAGDGAEVLSQLFRDGLEISHPHRREILEYIAQTEPFAVKRCATRTGGIPKKFSFLTEEVLGSDDVWFQASSRTADYARGSTLEGWKKQVALQRHERPGQDPRNSHRSDASATSMACRAPFHGRVLYPGKLAEIGIVIKAGQELRLVDVPVADQKYGIFHSLHRVRDGAQFANQLRAAASEHYGHAGQNHSGKRLRSAAQETCGDS
jgi:uncharacterized protein (DUF927 family)